MRLREIRVIMAVELHGSGGVTEVQKFTRNFGNFSIPLLQRNMDFTT
jgi:hypothetical protein